MKWRFYVNRLFRPKGPDVEPQKRAYGPSLWIGIWWVAMESSNGTRSYGGKVPVPIYRDCRDLRSENLNACLRTGEPYVVSHPQTQAPEHLLGHQDTQWYPYINENPHSALLVGQLNELPFEGVLE